MFVPFFADVMCFPAFCAQYRAALVADMDTGRVLYQENANELNYPASLTKIMTLYLTFDALEHGRLNLDDYLIVSQSAANAEPVKLGLSAGSKIRVEDAIKAVAVYSANDVARVLAENLKGGQEESFADLMTRVAREIKGKNLGNMPAQLCNAIAPLFDNGALLFIESSVSYVEPISKRSRHAKQAILFVELKMKLQT